MAERLLSLLKTLPPCRLITEAVSYSPPPLSLSLVCLFSLSPPAATGEGFRGERNIRGTTCPVRSSSYRSTKHPLSSKDRAKKVSRAMLFSGNSLPHPNAFADISAQQKNMTQPMCSTSHKCSLLALLAARSSNSSSSSARGSTFGRHLHDSQHPFWCMGACHPLQRAR